jgi:hypothetical protein
MAASEGHLEICKFLIDRGARINRSDRWEGSPLDDAHRHRHQSLILEKEHLPDPETVSKPYQPAPMEISVKSKCWCQVLLVRTPDINKGDYDKRTALAFGSRGRSLDIVVPVRSWCRSEC